MELSFCSNKSCVCILLTFVVGVFCIRGFYDFWNDDNNLASPTGEPHDEGPTSKRGDMENYGIFPSGSGSDLFLCQY